MEFLISANNLILNNWLLPLVTKQQHKIAFWKAFDNAFHHRINHKVQDSQEKENMPEHSSEPIFEVFTTHL